METASKTQMINRRSFVGGGITFAAVPTSLAQQPRPHRIALLDSQEPVQQLTDSGHAGWSAFLGELHHLGYTEGQNILIDRWSGEISAHEVMSRQPEVVVAKLGDVFDIWDKIGAPIVLVAFYEGDIDEDSFFEFYRENIVGRGSYDLLFERATELPKMQLQSLRQAVTGTERFAWLASNSYFDDCYGDCAPIRSAAQILGLGLHKFNIYNFDGKNEIERCFRSMVGIGCNGFLARPRLEDAELVGGLAIANRLPGMAKDRRFAEAGLLMCCQSNEAYLYRRGGRYVDKLLNGALPSQVTIEPAKFDLIINMRTARAIGLTPPRSLLDMASEIIE